MVVAVVAVVAIVVAVFLCAVVSFLLLMLMLSLLFEMSHCEPLANGAGDAGWLRPLQQQ